MHIFPELLETPGKPAKAVKPSLPASGTGAPGATRWNIFRYGFLAFTALALVGCEDGASVAGTYSAEVNPLQLIPGHTQVVELTVLYALPSNPKTATTVAYGARMVAPQCWSVAPSTWEFSHALKTTEIGVRDMRKLSVIVPADARHGPQLLKLSISPPWLTAQSVDLHFQVLNQGK